MGCCNVGNEKKSNINFKCPVCSNDGVKVQNITLESHLNDESMIKLDANLIYKFCKNEDCEVIYFSEDFNKIFKKYNLKTKVTLKDSGLDVNVCYCFGHTRKSVLDEIKSTGESMVLDDVKKKMKDPGCFCEKSNPQGGCCLSNVKDWVTKAKMINCKRKLEL